MIYLIDFENVHEEGFSALGRLGEKDAVYCFFTRNVAKISMSALAGMRSGQLHFIEAESGKQSLDLALVSYLGYLIGTRPQELYYDIVSNDNGFAKVAEFWNRRNNGLRVRVRKTTDLKQKSEAVRPQLQPQPQMQPSPVETAAETPTEPKQENQKAESPKPNQPKQRGRQRTQRQRASKQEQPQPTVAAVTASATGPEAVPAAPLVKEAVPVQPAEGKQSEAKPVWERIDLKQQEGKLPAEKPAAQQPESRTDEAPKTLPETRAEARPAEIRNPQPETKPVSAQKAESEARAEETPKAQPETKASEPAAALEAAGLNPAAVEFIQAQAEKYRDDKNMKQLVYRAVVKKYGQKNGTQIYNSAKKLLLK